MKYSLRSLMIASMVGPPLLAGGWYFGGKLLAWSQDDGARSFDCMPVTPRIIIQPEDEARLGLNSEKN